MIGGVGRGTNDYVLFIKELIEADKLRTVIERRYPLQEIAGAHRHAESGHKKGHVVVVVHQAAR